MTDARETRETREARTTREAREIHQTAVLLPAPPAVVATPAEQHRIDAALSRALSRAIHHDAVGAARREQALRLAGPTVVAASVAAVLGWCALAVGGTSSTPRDHRPVVAAPAAVVALHHASQAALLTSSTSPVGDDQFVYTRSTVVSNDGALGDGPVLGDPHEREVWVAQDPGPVDRVGVIREFGQDWPMEAGAPAPVGMSRPTYEWLDSLPTDPDALLTEIENDVWPVDADLDPDQSVFSRIGGLVAEGLVPPRTMAALFEAVTRIPGVTVDPDATDAVGRHGIGVSRGDDVIRSVWVFDPQTYEVLGTRDYLVTTGGDVLFGATAVLERGVADRSGERPGYAG